MSETKTVFATVVGRPNVGKSTLINRLVGCKVSIVSPKAQTTRGRVAGVITKDDCQYVFLDTPGMLKAKTGLENAMLKTITDSMGSTDITLFVVEAGDKVMTAEKKILRMLRENGMTAFLIVNKTDAVEKGRILETIAEFSAQYDFDEVIPLSARTRDGLDILMDELYKRASPSVFFYGEEYVSDMPEPNYVCEIVREKMLYDLGLEIPHKVALLSDGFDEDDECIRTSVSIYCNRESHKGIIIGKNGSMLKKISTEARRELEDYFGKKVYLECFVRVKEDWESSASMLARLGFE